MTSPTPPSARYLGLRHLAAYARRDCQGDAVIFSARQRSAAPVVAATDGISFPRATQVRRSLGYLEEARASGRRYRVADLGTLQDCRGLSDLGFESAVGAAIEIGTDRIGWVHVLYRTSRDAACEALLQAYARHAAVSIAAAGIPIHEVALPRETAQALDGLAVRAESFPELIGALDDALRPVFGSVMSGVMLWDESLSVLQMVPGSFGASARTAASYQTPLSVARSNAARVFLTAQSYFSNRPRGDPAILQDYVHAFGITQLLSVCLCNDTRKIGVLHVANKADGFSVEEMRLLDGARGQISAAVEIAQRLSSLSRELRLEAALAELAVGIASGSAGNESIPHALDNFLAATDAHAIALRWTDSPPVVAKSGDAHGDLRYLFAEGALKRDGGADGAVPTGVGDPGWATYHAPVWIDDTHRGAVSALRSRASPFAADERQALDRLAKLAGLAWTAERYQQQRAEIAKRAEQERIADDLHDDVAQLLYAAQLEIEAARTDDETSLSSRGELEKATRLLVKADAALRLVIGQLSPPGGATLTYQLATLVLNAQDEFNLPVHLEMSGAARTAADGLSKPVGAALLKAAREGIVNAAKHAGPCMVSVTLTITSRKRLALTITDEGVGISDKATAGHGLKSARRAVESRGGVLRTYARRSGSGTVVVASLPL